VEKTELNVYKEKEEEDKEINRQKINIKKMLELYEQETQHSIYSQENIKKIIEIIFKKCNEITDNSLNKIKAKLEEINTKYLTLQTQYKKVLKLNKMPHELYIKINEKMKIQKELILKEKLLENTNSNLKLEISELNNQYNEKLNKLVKNQNNENSNNNEQIWKFAIYTPITIVFFIVSKYF